MRTLGDILSGKPQERPVELFQPVAAACATLSAALEPYVSAGKLEAWAESPTKWIGERTGEHLWSKQVEIFESVRDNRRTAVHSAHGIGKSYLAARIAAWWIDCHPPGEAKVITSAPTGPQVRAILWQEIHRAHSAGKLPGRLNQVEWMLPVGDHEELVGFGRKPSDYEPTAFQGIHERYVLVIFDESAGMPLKLYEAGDSLISGADCRFLSIGNPDDPTSEFAKICRPGSGWNAIGISVFDSPNFTGEEVPDAIRHKLTSKLWAEEKLAQWGADHPMYIARVLGQFPETNEGGLIPLSWIKAAQDRDLEVFDTDPVEIGVDVGGGVDKNVIAIRHGGRVRIIKSDLQPDTMKTLGNAMRAVTENGGAKQDKIPGLIPGKVSAVKVDNIGIGKGAVDRAKEIAADPMKDPNVRASASVFEGVNVAMAAKDSEHYANLKAEGWWGVRERFREGSIDIDPNDDELAGQLADLRFVVTSTGKMRMEKKEDMKKRRGRSPDEADALMLALIRPPSKSKVSAVWGRSRR